MFSNLDKILILDGATGTELQKRGLGSGDCPETWVLQNPESFKDLQRSYAKAGSNCVYAPTFGANRASLKSHGISRDVKSLCRDLVELSREAVPDTVMVGGDIASTGLQLMPFGMTSFQELIDIFTEQAAALDDAGVDFFAIETMMSLPEARAALLAVRSVSDKPVLVSFACNDSGRSVMGTDLCAGLLSLQDMGANAYGINCCGNLELIAKVLGSMRPYSRLPLLAKPNAGLPDTSSGKAVYHMAPSDFAQAALVFIEGGAAILGGCCGTYDAHIAALASSTAGVRPLSSGAARTAVAASQTRVVDIDSDTCIIEKPVSDDLLDSMAEVLSEGGDLMGLHIRDEEDIEYVDDCQYGLSIPLCLTFEDEELKAQFAQVYHGKPYIL